MKLSEVQVSPAAYAYEEDAHKGEAVQWSLRLSIRMFLKLSPLVFLDTRVSKNISKLHVFYMYFYFYAESQFN